MSAYDPPTQILSVFNPLFFESTSLADLDVSYLNENYLKFPIAQGLENLQKTNITDTTQSTGVDSGSLVTAGGVGIAKATHIGGQLHCTSTATSSGTTTGCIRANGGVGIAENINAGGIIKTTSTTASTDTTTGALVVAGGVGVAENINAGGIIKTTNATANNSTDTTTGALVVTGGASFGSGITTGSDTNLALTTASPGGGRRYLEFGSTSQVALIDFHSQDTRTTDYDARIVSTGGSATTGTANLSLTASQVDTAGILKTTNTTSSTDINSGALQVGGGVGVVGRINAGGIIKTTTTTPATDINSGALQVGGGAGIVGRIYAGGVITTTTTVASTDTTTGALVVGGGAGIAGAINAGGIIKTTNATANNATDTTTGALVVTGGASFGSGITTGSDTNLALTTASPGGGRRYLEFGSGSQVALIDFHSQDSRTTDYDARIISTGGSATTGTANLTIEATKVTMTALALTTDSATKTTTNTWTISSDRRIKEDITDANLDLCYSIAKNLKLRRFKWKDYIGYEGDKSVVGYIAQEVQEIFPKAVDVTKKILEKKNENGEIVQEEIEDFLSLNVDQIQKTLHGAIQKLIINTEQQQTQIEQLQKQNQSLEQRLTLLESLLNK